jgi:excinuclease ABC subunit B
MKNYEKCTTASLLSGRRDILVVTSLVEPVEFQKNLIPIEKGQIISLEPSYYQLCKSLYSRTEAFNPGSLE